MCTLYTDVDSSTIRIVSRFLCLRDKISDSENELATLRDEEINQKENVDSITPAYKQFKTWAEEFDDATPEQKKMIVCNLFRRIEVSRGYQISVELNMTYQQFCDEWNGKNNLIELSAV